MKLNAIISLLLLLLALETFAIVVVDSSEDNYPLCPCYRMYMPVCGNNGVTYDNPCEFECARKYLAKKGTKIAIAYNGFCKQAEILLKSGLNF